VQDEGPLSSQGIIDLLFAPGKTVEERKKHSLLREAVEGLITTRGGPTSRGLGRVLTRYRGRVFNKKKIERVGQREWTVIDKTELDKLLNDVS
jgi:hypothetical protein